MDRVLARLERKLGRFAIERMAVYLIAGMVVTFVLGLIRPDIVGAMLLDPRAIAQQPWRVISFLFVPPATSPLFLLFALSFLWFVGSSLEETWGAFKLNVYYLVGVLGTIAAAFITGAPQSNQFLNESLFFAIATLAPNHQVLLLVIPVRLKWLALIGVVLIGSQFVAGDFATRIAIGISFANYLLFFSGHIVSLLRGKQLERQSAARRASFRPPPAESSESAAESRACAICGARQSDGADIRVCSCEKCGGVPRQLCLEHARNH